jgi:hypothetical protein
MTENHPQRQVQERFREYMTKAALCSLNNTFNLMVLPFYVNIVFKDLKWKKLIVFQMAFGKNYSENV